MEIQSKTIGSPRELKRPSMLGGLFSRAYMATGDTALKVITVTSDAVNTVKDIAKSHIQILEELFIRDRTSITSKQLNHLIEHYITIDNSPCFNDMIENIEEYDLSTDRFYTPFIEKAIIYLTENCIIRHDIDSALKLLNYYGNLYCTISRLQSTQSTRSTQSTQLNEKTTYTDTLTKMINLLKIKN